MKKIIDKLKKYDYIIVSIIILIVVVITVFQTELDPTDNLWCYGNIYKLFTGKKLYSEVNTVQTHIFFVMGEMLFKLFGANYYTFMAYGICTMFIFYILLYQILRTLKIRKLLSVFGIVTIISISLLFLRCAPNYNTMGFVFIELGVLYNLKNKEKRKFDFLINAILIILSGFTLQKLGLSYIIGYTFCELYKNESKKQAIVNLLKTASMTIIILSIIVLVLNLQGNLDSFIDVCVLGVKEFISEVSIVSLIRIVCSAILAISFLFVLKKRKLVGKEFIQNAFMVLGFAVGTSIIVFPIINEYHSILANMLWMILLIYEFSIIIEALLSEKIILNLIYAVIIFTTLALLLKTLSLLIQPTEKQRINDKNNIFYGALISKEITDNIKNVEEYIRKQEQEGRDVKVLSTYAMLYTLELDINNWYFDEPLKGNMGLNGDQKMINYINSMKNGVLLVEDEEKSTYSCFQFTEEVRDYVEENYEYIESIENYKVYLINPVAEN